MAVTILMTGISFSFAEEPEVSGPELEQTAGMETPEEEPSVGPDVDASTEPEDAADAGAAAEPDDASDTEAAAGATAEPDEEPVEAEPSDEEAADEEPVDEMVPEGFDVSALMQARANSSCPHKNLYVYEDTTNEKVESLGEYEHRYSYLVLSRTLECSDCGMRIQTITVNKTEYETIRHHWSNWKDYGSKAYNEFYCTGCGAYKKVKLPCNHNHLGEDECGNYYCMECDAVLIFFPQTCSHKKYTIWEHNRTYADGYYRFSPEQHLKHMITPRYTDRYRFAICDDCGEWLETLNGKVVSVGITDYPFWDYSESSALEKHSFVNRVCTQCGQEEQSCKHGATRSVENTDKMTTVVSRVDGNKHKLTETRYYDLYCTTCGAYVGEGDKLTTSREEAHKWNEKCVCTVCGYGEPCAHEYAAEIHYTVGQIHTDYKWTGKGNTHDVISYRIFAECYYCPMCNKVYIPAKGDTGAVNKQDFVSADFAMRETGRYTENCYMTNGWTQDYYSCNYCGHRKDSPAKPKVTLTAPANNSTVDPDQALKVKWSGTLLGYEGDDNYTDYEYVFCHVIVTEQGLYYDQGAVFPVYSGKKECTIPAGTMKAGKVYNIFVTFGNQSSYYDMIGAKATVTAKQVGDPNTPKGVVLDREGTVTLNMGSKLTLHATMQPATATRKLSWTSSSAKVATVDQNGVVTPVKEGTVTITVKTHNGKKDTVKIKVVDPYKPTGVVLDREGTVTLEMGSTLTLHATMQPATATRKLSWTSSSAKVATVDPNGVVTPLKEGTVTITVKTHNGKKDTVKIKVVDPYKPTGVVLDREGTVTLEMGSTLTLHATMQPATATRKLSWTSSSTKVATVDPNGVVTPVKEGTVTITVRTHNGKYDKVKVKVVK